MIFDVAMPAHPPVMADIKLPHDEDRRNDRVEHDEPARMSDVALGQRLAAEQRGRAEQRLIALGEMTGGIIHDFRNVLATVTSALRLAERWSEEPEKVRASIAGAREGVDRGLRLTSQLLTFAKQQELEPYAVDVNETLRNLELFLKYGAGSRVRIVFEPASDIPKCLIDPSRFSNAVLNLVLNARDAMPKGGDVLISTKRWSVESTTPGSPAPGIYVRVRVKDSGTGMSPEVMRRIVDPFFTTKGESGTGLGVPQVCAFMRLSGGHLSVTSEQGVGTTVDLLFPSAEPAEIVSRQA